MATDTIKWEDELPKKPPPMLEYRILIVDDEPSVYNALYMALNHILVNGRKLKLYYAFSRSDAIAHLSRTKFHLVITDVVMESPTAGLELAKYIKTNISKTLPVVFVRSGMAPNLEAFKGLYDEFIDKTDPTIVAKVKEHL